MFYEKESMGHSGDNILDGSRLRALGTPTISLDEILIEAASEIRDPQTPEGTPRYNKEHY